MTQKFSAWEIRKLFPNPSPASGSDEEYCVGGALSCYLARKEAPPTAVFPFPTIEELSDILSKANPDLTREDANEFAEAIILENDEGNIEKAWELLQSALQKGN